MSDEVLVRVDNVSKKFCKSLKRSLWYGMCDTAQELNPFGVKGPGCRLQVPPVPTSLPPLQPVTFNLKPSHPYVMTSFGLLRMSASN